MPNSFAVGFSQADDPKEAAHQAAVVVKNSLNSITTDFVLVMSSIHYAQKETFDVIQTILKPKKLIGSSTHGVYVSSGLYKRGIAILGVNSPEFQFGIGVSEFKTKYTSRQFGFELSRQIVADYKSPIPRRAAIFFYDSLMSYENSFLLGAKEVLGHNTKILAGFSCDDFKLRFNYQYYQQQILSKNVAGFIIGAENPIAVSNKHAFKPLGKPRKLTSVKNNIIQKIDGKPAISIYENFIKKDAETIKAGFLNSPACFYPLGIYSESLRKYLIRYPLDILSDGSIVCQAEVPADAEVHLMITNKDSCKNTATLIAQEVKDILGNHPPQLLIMFNSMTKNKILGRYSPLELEAVQKIFGTTVPLIGMYTFGELSPLTLNDQTIEPSLQNGSMTLLAIN